MKKLLMSLTTLVTLVLGIGVVNAKLVDLSSLDTNTYIIGSRIYELNTYRFSIYDAVEAASEYAAKTGEQAPIYSLSKSGETVSVVEYTGGFTSAGDIPTKSISVEEVFKNGQVDATYKNGVKLEDDEQDESKLDEIVALTKEAINNAIEKVNNAKLGIEASVEGETIKFVVDGELNETLAKAKDIIESEYSNYQSKMVDSVSVEYDVAEGTITGDAKEIEDLSSLAKNVINNLTDGEVKVSLIFAEGEKGDTLDYTVIFTEKEAPSIDDAIALVDAKIKATVNEINEAKLGIEAEYSNNKATFNVTGDLNNLSKAKDIVVKNILAVKDELPEGITVKYSIDGYVTDEEVSLLDEDAIVSLAKTIINSLNDGSSVTATVNYDNGEENRDVNYTAEFNVVADKVEEAVENTKNAIDNAAKEIDGLSVNGTTITFETDGDLTEALKSLKDKVWGLFDSYKKSLPEGVTVSLTVGNKNYSIDNINSEADLTDVAKELLDEAVNNNNNIGGRLIISDGNNSNEEDYTMIFKSNE